MKKWTSKPRPVRVIHKETGASNAFPSVAEAGRSIGLSPHSAFAMLSGRAGKRSAYRLEYVDGKPSRAKQQGKSCVH